MFVTGGYAGLKSVFFHGYYCSFLKECTSINLLHCLHPTGVKEVVNGDIWFLDGKRLEPKELLWEQHQGCNLLLL